MDLVIKKSLALVLLLLSICNAVQGRSLDEIKRSGVIVVGVDGMSPPFNFYKEGRLVGFEVDLLDKIAANMNLKIKWVIQPFNTLLTGIRQDRFDLIGTSHTITPERSKVVEFIRPHYCNDAVMVSKPNGPHTLAELNGKVVVVAVGTVYFDRLKATPNIKEIRTVPSETEGLQALLAGRADTWVTEQPIAIEAIKAVKKNNNLKIGAALLQQKNAMSVMKGNVGLQRTIDQELKRLVENGTYDRLQKQYFQDSVSCFR